MSEYDQSSAYENYDSNDGLSPYELLMQMQSWNKAIYLRIENAEKELQTQFSILDGEIRQEVSDFQEEMSTIVSTTAAGIRADMVNADKQLSTQLTTTAEGINATINSTKQGLQTQITANATGIASKVSATDYTGQKVASLITQDANAINLIANKLNLSGYVTFSSLGPYGTTEIDGSRVRTGYIAADRLDAQAIRSKVIQAGGLSADYIQSGTLSSMNIVGSTIVSDAGWARVTLANGAIEAYDGFMGSTSRMDGSFLATNSYGDMADLYPNRLLLQSGGSQMNITATSIGANSGVMFSGSYDFSNATVRGLQVTATEAKWITGNTGVWWGPNDFAQSRTSGLGFGFSSASKRLYVSMNGSDVGSVTVS